MTNQSKVLLDGLVFPESPRWHDGRLWFSDIQAHRVISVGLNGDSQIVGEFDDEPSGLGFLSDGSLLVVLRVQRQLVCLEANRMRAYANLREYSGPAVGTGPPPSDYLLNDMVVDARGRAYIDKFMRRHAQDQGADLGESLLFVSAEGHHRVAADGLMGPNGLAVTPDGRTLIVAESPLNRLTAFTVQPDGSLTDRRLFAHLGQHRPDGICLDEEGAVWVAGPWAHQVLRVLEGGRVTQSVSTGDKGPLACALGGEDRRTLLIASATFEQGRWSEAHGFIEYCSVDVAGAGWP